MNQSQQLFITTTINIFKLLKYEVNWVVSIYDKISIIIIQQA